MWRSGGAWPPRARAASESGARADDEAKRGCKRADDSRLLLAPGPGSLTANAPLRSGRAAPRVRLRPLEPLLALLDDAFPGFAESERIARGRGLRWEDCSTPFVVEEAGAVVAHVGVLELPLVVDGREILAGGVHAVATRVERRGRGHMRELMEEALLHCEGRYETLVLTAGTPDVYAKFGFRAVTEHRFVLDAPPPVGTDAWRPLDLAAPSDLSLLHRLLRERSSVSNVLGVVRELPVFLFDTTRASLAYFPALDAIVWFTRKDGTLRLHDVVARDIPPLGEILARVSGPLSRVECGFAPDRLDASFRAAPWLFDGEEHLMVRGPFVESGPATLPRSARC
jgi:predicted N-acetyltransferase YhbS